MLNWKLYLLIVAAVVIISCNERKKSEQKPVVDTIENRQRAKEKEAANSKKDFSRIKKQSFVISCGSGCAMTYNVKDINQLNATSIRVVFDVDTYIDEEQTENLVETYIFDYNSEHNIEKITREGENENVLDNLIGGAQQTFKEFAAELIKYNW